MFNECKLFNCPYNVDSVCQYEHDVCFYSNELNKTKNETKNKKYKQNTFCSVDDLIHKGYKRSTIYKLEDIKKK